MKHTSVKNIIKLSGNVRVIFNHNASVLIICGKIGKRILHLNVRIFLGRNQIKVTHLPLNWPKTKPLKSLQTTTAVWIKNAINESNTTFYKRLQFVGVGYRAYNLSKTNRNVVMLKLGFSHNIYFKIASMINVSCLKLTSVFLYGNCYKNVCKIASEIRSIKRPEIYKGKGIRFFDENIVLKEGKKI